MREEKRSSSSCRANKRKTKETGKKKKKGERIRESRVTKRENQWFGRKKAILEIRSQSWA